MLSEQLIVDALKYFKDFHGFPKVSLATSSRMGVRECECNWGPLTLFNLRQKELRARKSGWMPLKCVIIMMTCIRMRVAYTQWP